MTGRVISICGLLLLVMAAGASGASPSSPWPSVTAGPAVPVAELDPTVAAAYTGVAIVSVNGSCSGVLVAPAGTAPADAPGYVLTNGHCLGYLEPTEVLRDVDGSGYVTFGWPGGPVRRLVDVASIPWATMKGTDLMVLELDATLAELRASGIQPLTIAGPGRSHAGRPIVVVGAPASLDGTANQLILARCLQGEGHDIVEGAWSFTAFPVNDCADIRPGSSGSPVFDAGTGELIGLINTTTGGSEGLSDCLVGRPCEVTADGAVSREGAVYGPTVARVAACFGPDGRFSVELDGCPLDPGYGMNVSGATAATNPDVARPNEALPVTTWHATLRGSDPSITHRAVKAGVAGRIDCSDIEGYGAPEPFTHGDLYDAPLPQLDEGLVQLCVLGGPGATIDQTWQEPVFPSVVTTRIDRTPPATFHVDTWDDGDRWQVYPVSIPFEISGFAAKWGEPAEVDCRAGTDYRDIVSLPIAVPKADAPIRLCLTAYDEAGNRSSPQVLELVDDRSSPSAS